MKPKKVLPSSPQKVIGEHKGERESLRLNWDFQGVGTMVENKRSEEVGRVRKRLSHSIGVSAPKNQKFKNSNQ